MSYQPPLIKKFFHSSRRILAKYWLSLQPTFQIAITGSHGKTNTANVLTKVLESIGTTERTDLDLDTTYNVPITALKVTPWTRFAVFELGVDREKDMDAALEIVKPKIGIVTGIAPVHTDKEHLGSLANVIKEKQKLIEALPKDGYAILNYDDINVRSMAQYTKAQIIWYGTDKKKCDVWVDSKTIKFSLDGTSFKLRINKSPRFETHIKTKLIGKHHIYTIMAIAATLQAIQSITQQSTPMNRIIGAISSITPLHGRMSVEKGPMETVLLNDSLRANPSSTKSGLETLSEITYNKGKKIAVLGEMGELEKPEEEHKKIIELVKKLQIDFVVTIGNLYIESPNIYHTKNVHEAVEVLKKLIHKNDLIYLKGSLLRHVERVTLILEGKNVGCTVTLCPFYYNCIECQYLEKGYQRIESSSQAASDKKP